MATTEELRVPKLPVTVELAVVEEGIREARVYVADHRAGSPQRQRVLDLLESEPQFLPAVDEDGELRIFNKATLLWVAIPLVEGALPVEEESGEGVLYDVRREVEVVLQGGETLRGDLLYSPPPEQTRVVDYLNRGGRFLRLWSTDRIVLVNKNRISSVLDRAAATAERSTSESTSEQEN